MLTPLDLFVLAAYAVGIVALGLRSGGKQSNTQDYFLGGRDLPWWAVCFSVVATETSTLTVIGVPAIAYGGAMTFLQLAFGYLVGRVIVATYFLPKYFAGDLQTAYAYLGDRFGDGMRGLASVTFLATRLLADGVRLFATAIPIKVILQAAGFEASYPLIILGIGIVTAAYTYVGGLKAVVWMDVVQMGVYVGGALIVLFMLWPAMADGGFAAAAAEGKLQVFDWAGGLSFAEIVTSPYAFPVALLGGAVFAMASHGTDQLIVQRILACRSLGEGQKAMVWSGVFVGIQFAIFLAVGLGLWVFYLGQSPAGLGLSRGDEIFPKYILENMPQGLRGLLLAGIIAAAMSTLSSSLNALAGSTMIDLLERFGGARPDPASALRMSRILTVVWAVVFMGFAMLFEGTDNPVVELGLGIAGFTYGGLLGAFLLGLLNKRARQTDAIVSFVVTITAMVFLIFGLWWSADANAWTFVWHPDADTKAAGSLKAVAWPLYPLIGATLMMALGSLLAIRRPSAGAEPVASSSEL